MKLHKLIIKNIASLVDASIDFSSDALRNEPVFLITGNTGSGKTSILNAICIALYNQVPALDEGAKEEDNQQVKTSSPLQLVRRLCKEASISLEISDKEDTLYTFEWHATRKTKGKDKGQFSSIKRSVAIKPKGCMPEFYTSVKEIKETVDRVVGLTFDQFCRTTMLAQGQFLKFLNSEKKHKSEILEKITGTEIYSLVGQQIYAISRQHKQAYEALDNQIKGAHLLTDEEKLALTEAIEAISKQIEEAKNGLSQIETHEKWLEAVAQRTSDLDKATAALSAATSEDKIQQINTLKTAIADWDATADIRRILDDKLSAEQGFTSKNKEVSDLRPTFVALSQGLAYLVKSIGDKRKQLADTQSEIEQEKQYEPLYLSQGEILTIIRVIEDETTKATQCQLRIDKAQTDLVKATTESEKQQKSVDTAKDALAEQQAILDPIAKACEGVDVTRLNAQKDADKASLEACEKAIAAHQLLVESEEELGKKTEEIAKLNDDLTSGKALRDKALEDVNKFKAASDDAASRLQGQMDLSDHLTQLTQIFADTKACPLCGSDVQHLHPREIIDAAIAEAQASAKKAKDEYDAAVEAANEQVATVKSLETSIKKAQGEAEKLQLQTDKKRKAFEAFGIPADNLQTQHEKCSKALEISSLALSVALDQMAKLKEATTERDNRRTVLDDAVTLLDKAKQKVADIEAGISNDRALLKTNNDNKEAKLAELSALLATAPHPELSVSDLAAVKDKLPKLKKNFDLLLSTASDLQTKITDLERTQTEVEDKLALVISSYGPVDQTVEPREYPDLSRKAVAFTTKVTLINGQIEEINRQRNSLTDKEKEYFGSHNRQETLDAIDRLAGESADSIAGKRTKVNNYAESVAALKGQVEQLENQIAELNNHRPISLPEEATLAQTVANKNEAKANVDTLSQQRAKDAGLLEQNERREREVADLKQRCELAKKESSKWEILNRMLGTESGERFRTLAQSYIFGLLLRSANKYLSQLTDRYTLAGEAGSLLIYVIDHHDGDNKRVSKVLSGGEGFMASLSLALALSTINQELDPLDILFIDEGFGALDPTTRENTIEMLCGLSRRVGIISHMPELRENIPTQIVVTRQYGTSRATIQIQSPK